MTSADPDLQAELGAALHAALLAHPHPLLELTGDGDVITHDRPDCLTVGEQVTPTQALAALAPLLPGARQRHATSCSCIRSYENSWQAALTYAHQLAPEHRPGADPFLQRVLDQRFWLVVDPAAPAPQCCTGGPGSTSSPLLAAVTAALGAVRHEHQGRLDPHAGAPRTHKVLLPSTWLIDPPDWDGDGGAAREALAELARTGHPWAGTDTGPDTDLDVVAFHLPQAPARALAETTGALLTDDQTLDVATWRVLEALLTGLADSGECADLEQLLPGLLQTAHAATH